MGVARLINAATDSEIRHSIAILGSDRSLLEEVNADISCYALGISGRSYTAFLRLAKLFRCEQVDLVHVNNLAPWFDAAFGAKLSGCPCIQTFHGVEDGMVSFSLAKQMLFRAASQMSVKITAVADEAADLMARLTGLSRSAVEVICNGIDTTRFAPAPSIDARCELRRTKGLPEDGLLFGCVAALRPVKNHVGLLRAFATATTVSKKTAALVLVGDGALTAELESLATDLQISDRVYFLGRRIDISELLQCFDAFVLNSDTEGLSYAVLEAMSCGLPLIGTAVGGNVRLVADGKEGLLVPVGDENAMAVALVEAMSDISRLRLMGQAARRVVLAEYGHEEMVDRYCALYGAFTDTRRC